MVNSHEPELEGVRVNYINPMVTILSHPLGSCCYAHKVVCTIVYMKPHSIFYDSVWNLASFPGFQPVYHCECDFMH